MQKGTTPPKEIQVILRLYIIIHEKRENPVQTIIF